MISRPVVTCRCGDSDPDLCSARFSNVMQISKIAQCKEQLGSRGGWQIYYLGEGARGVIFRGPELLPLMPAGWRLRYWVETGYFSVVTAFIQPRHA